MYVCIHIILCMYNPLVMLDVLWLLIKYILMRTHMHLCYVFTTHPSVSEAFVCKTNESILCISVIVNRMKITVTSVKSRDLIGLKLLKIVKAVADSAWNRSLNCLHSNWLRNIQISLFSSALCSVQISSKSNIYFFRKVSNVSIMGHRYTNVYIYIY